ncbi:MAG: hypothetical protein WA082_03250 [Candidatus Moraniibacteriota bacterium]
MLHTIQCSIRNFNNTPKEIIVARKPKHPAYYYAIRNRISEIIGLAFDETKYLALFRHFAEIYKVNPSENDYSLKIIRGLVQDKMRHRKMSSRSQVALEYLYLSRSVAKKRTAWVPATSQQQPARLRAAKKKP